VPGYPIRKPSDHSSVDSSPRHIAASHVLHRPLMPRHPPCALNNLHHNNTTQRHQEHQRCSHPLYNSQTPTRQPQHRTTYLTTKRFDSVLVPEHFSQENHHTKCGCCLRTQQHADTPPSPRPLQHPFHTHPERRAVLEAEQSPTVTHPVVPQFLEQPIPLRTVATDQNRPSTTHKMVFGCSLERR
jgi:hypothetical protein